MTSTPQYPPTDGSIAVLPGLADFHAEHNPDRPWAIYPLTDSDEASITWLEFVKATHRLAHWLRPHDDNMTREVVGMLIHCDTILYVTLLVAIARAGLVPFPISSRNSSEAVANLLAKTSCRIVITQQSLRHLLSQVQSETDGISSLHVLDLPDIRIVYPGIEDTPGALSTPEVEPYPPINKPAEHDMAMYLHSAGSTGLPKPIPLTQKIFLQWVNNPMFGGTRKYASRWAAGALPTFHSMGVLVQLIAPLVSAQPVGLYGPKYPAPPVVPNPQNVLEMTRRTGSDTIMSVPAFVEIWAESDENVAFLKSLKMVFFGGGPLSVENGNKLVATGVVLISGYGVTEAGPVCHPYDAFDSDPADPNTRGPEDWQWQKVAPCTNPRWVPQGDGTYELQFLTCETHQPSVENLPDVPGYATNDLWEPHPRKKGLWRIVGRKDDVIVLGSGEKIVPIPQERHIGSHPWVADAVMFGRARPQAGVLVDPAPDYVVDPADDAAVTQFIDNIWSHIEQANAEAPSFARIFREMVIVTDPAKPLTRAAKGNVQRKRALELYAEEIEKVYAAAEAGTPADVTTPSTWNAEDVETWLLSLTALVNQEASLHPTIDIFEQGFDSLHATFIRNHIVKALRSSADSDISNASKRIDQNIVYAHPTIRGLAEFLSSTLSAQHNGAHSADQARLIEQMVAKYSTGLTKLPAMPPVPLSGAVVLLTGSTGSLGSYLLSTLLTDPRVSKVYAFNRPSKATADRQRASFEDRGLPSSLLDDEKCALVTGDFNSGNFGLDDTTYRELSTSVTHVIHNAWKVDFNHALGSFESQIAGTRKLVDFCSSLGRSVRILYTSSVGVAHGWQPENGPVPESPLNDPEYASDSGYSASKYVVEQLLSKAHETGLEATSLRVGQVCGSAASGAWNVTDWFPILVKSSVAMGTMPNLDEPVTWIPVDQLATAMTDLVFSADRLPQLMNVVHPRPVSWEDIMQSACKTLDVSLRMVGLKEWLDTLEELSEKSSPEIVDSIPAIKLLGFLHTLLPPQASADQSHRPSFATSELQRYSQTMRSLESLDVSHVNAWMQYWLNKGLFPQV